MEDYTLDQVMLFAKAGLRNWRFDHVQEVTGLAVAISHALDLSFNKGKGKVLDKYVKKILESDDGSKKEGTVKGPTKMSDEVLSFFARMPRKAS